LVGTPNSYLHLRLPLPSQEPRRSLSPAPCSNRSQMPCSSPLRDSHSTLYSPPFVGAALGRPVHPSHVYPPPTARSAPSTDLPGARHTKASAPRSLDPLLPSSLAPLPLLPPPTLLWSVLQRCPCLSAIAPSEDQSFNDLFPKRCHFPIRSQSSPGTKLVFGRSSIV
jgi:hypothetical protein